MNEEIKELEELYYTNEYLNKQIELVNNKEFVKDFTEPYLEKYFELTDKSNQNTDIFFEIFKQQIINQYKTQFKPILKYFIQDNKELCFFDFSKQQEKILDSLTTVEFSMLVTIFEYDFNNKDFSTITKIDFLQMSNNKLSEMKSLLKYYIERQISMDNLERIHKSFNGFSKFLQYYSESYQFYFNYMNGKGYNFFIAKLTELERQLLLNEIDNELKK